MFYYKLLKSDFSPMSFFSKTSMTLLIGLLCSGLTLPCWAVNSESTEDFTTDPSKITPTNTDTLKAPLDSFMGNLFQEKKRLFRVSPGFRFGKESFALELEGGLRATQFLDLTVASNKEYHSTVDHWVDGQRSPQTVTLDSIGFLVRADLKTNTFLGIDLGAGLDFVQITARHRYSYYEIEEQEQKISAIAPVFYPRIYVAGEFLGMELRAGAGLRLRGLSESMTYKSAQGETVREELPSGMKSSFGFFMDAHF